MTSLQPSPTTVQLLPFYCPFGSAINSAAAEIEQMCIDWIDRFELYQSSQQRKRLIGTKAAEIYSRALPAAEPARVADVAKWLYWGFATDDLFYDNGPMSARAADFISLAAMLVRITEEPRARFAWEPPYTDALRDLVRAIWRHCTPSQLIDWTNTSRAWFFGMSWDVGNAERGVPPMLNDYVMMRMHTGGLASWVTTLNIANGIELSPAVASSGRVRALTEAWSTMALFLNDLMSFAKESLNSDTSSNLITVIAAERACTPSEAVPEAYRICDRIGNLFMALRDRLLSDGDETMRRYIAGLEHTWRGILEWGFTAARYRRGGDPDAPTLQTFPGWREEPADPSLEPLPFPSVAWWWDELHA